MTKLFYKEYNVLIPIKISLIFYRQYYGIFHPLYGIHLLKLSKINLYLECINEAYTLLKEADEVLRVTHGVDHQLYKEEFIPIFIQAKAAITA